MAAELRQHRLRDTSVASLDDTNEFANVADNLMHIRRVVFDGHTEDSTEGKSLFTKQLSKATSYQQGNGEVPYTMQKTIGADSSGATATAAESTSHASWVFQRGQLTLEPGEALHTHTLLVADAAVGSADGNWFIDFEY